MRRHSWLFLTGVFSVLFSIPPGHALLRLKVQQAGNDVVISGSGSADTSALTLVGTNNDWTNVLSDNQIYAGPDAFGDGSGAGADVNLWGSITGPAVSGTIASVVNPDSGSGDLFGILAAGASPAPQLVLPLSYSSGTDLNGSSTLLNQTLDSLGLTPGSTFTWSWGSNGSADSLVLEVQGAPSSTVPAPLPILGAALGLAQSRQLRRRIKAGGRLIAQ